MPKINFVKMHSDAKIPFQKHDSDAGFDLTAVGDIEVDGNVATYRTGIALETPAGWYWDIRPRSSISKTNLVLCNGPGTVDSDYVGEIIVKFRIVPHKDQPAVMYSVGDRIAQLVLQRKHNCNFVETDKLSETARGSGGFGSTGT